MAAMAPKNATRQAVNSPTSPARGIAAPSPTSMTGGCCAFSAIVTPRDDSPQPLFPELLVDPLGLSGLDALVQNVDDFLVSLLNDEAVGLLRECFAHDL